MKLEDFARQVDELIELGHRVHATEGTTEWGGAHTDSALFAEFRSAALSFLRNVFGKSHPYTQEFEARAQHGMGDHVKAGIGVLTAARAELQAGWARTTYGLVSAEVFSDFLEMADHLLAEAYKDPAAVMIGSVLEQHLRHLGENRGVDTTRTDGKGKTVHLRADAINAGLAREGVIPHWIRSRSPLGSTSVTRRHMVIMPLALTSR